MGSPCLDFVVVDSFFWLEDIQKSTIGFGYLFNSTTDALRVELVGYFQKHIIFFVVEIDSAFMSWIEQGIDCSRMHQEASPFEINQIDYLLELGSLCID